MVSPSDYRDYYSKFGINAFCDSCGYEFRGQLRDVELSDEELEEYEDSHGITKARRLYAKLPKKKWFETIAKKIGESLSSQKKIEK